MNLLIRNRLDYVHSLIKIVADRYPVDGAELMLPDQHSSCRKDIYAQVLCKPGQTQVYQIARRVWKYANAPPENVI